MQMTREMWIPFLGWGYPLEKEMATQSSVLAWRIPWTEEPCLRRLESPLDFKEIQPVSLKGNQPCILIVKTDSEAEVPIFWLPDAKSLLTGKDPDAGKSWMQKEKSKCHILMRIYDAKSWLIGKDLDVGKDWREEEKGTTEDEMVGWNHWLDGYEFEQALRVIDEQGSLACCIPWGRKESDTTEWLNWTDQHFYMKSLWINDLPFVGFFWI